MTNAMYVEHQSTHVLVVFESEGELQVSSLPSVQTGWADQGRVSAVFVTNFRARQH